MIRLIPKLLPKPGKFAIFAFPLLFFSFSSLIIIGSSFYLLNNPYTLFKMERKIVPKIYSIFSATPPAYALSYESLIFGDARPIITEQFLASHRSTLTPYARLLVETADKYGVDWKLPIAIAGQESTFCRTIPDDSHNCWGFGVHSRGTLKFASFEEAIEKVTKYLKTDYLDRGLTTPKQIMTRYAPISLSRGGSWAEGVEFFLDQLQNF